MKVMSIFGTRPEMIKMWGTLKKLDELNFEHIMVHTGQNFTPELRDFFFRDLQLRKPDFELGIDTSSYAREVSDVISKSDALSRTRSLFARFRRWVSTHWAALQNNLGHFCGKKFHVGNRLCRMRT